MYTATKSEAHLIGLYASLVHGQHSFEHVGVRVNQRIASCTKSGRALGSRPVADVGGLGIVGAPVEVARVARAITRIYR